jgi:hypothetical protein
MRIQSALAALVAVLGLLFGGSAQAVTFFTDTCSGGGAALTCTFTASPGFLFLDSGAANLNLAGTVTSASESFTGGNATSSSISFNSPQNVDGFGTFNFTDDLSSSGSPGNPTAATITFTISGSGLALLANSSGNDASAHICQISTGTACSSTFFATPSGQVSAVPLPGALPLFATGLAGLVVLGRRRMKQAAASAA